MRQRKFIIIFFISCFAYCQNKQLLYNFNAIPQSLNTNPGADVSFKWHAGIPLLSGNYITLGSSGFSTYDLFAKNNIDFNTKLRNVVSKASSKDNILVNEQIEILNGGFSKKNNYYSFGLYQEFDLLTYFPEDIILLALDGNKEYVGKYFNLGESLDIRAELLSVYHFGVQKKITQKFTLGTRFKIYNSSLNLTSSNNSGYVYTIPGTTFFYDQYIYSDLKINSSGIDPYFNNNNNNNSEDNINKTIKRTFLGGSLGLGIDAGFTYYPKKRIQITASVLDLGFINHTKQIKNYSLQGNYQYVGVNPTFEPNSSLENVLDNINEAIPLVENQESYTTIRPLKLNTSIQYAFEKRKSEQCDCTSQLLEYKSAVGFHFFTRAVISKKPILAFTTYFKRDITRNFQIKATYTVDSFTYKNIGLGFSSKIGLVHFYVLADNLLSYQDISKANELSLQFGINLVSQN
jgi:hypothetical protein